MIQPTLSCGQCEACLEGQHHVCKTLRLIGIDRHGGFAEYVSVPLDRLHAIPDGLSDSLAAVAEPLAVGVHTVRRSRMKVGDSVAVLGCGPIGLIVALVARHAGAKQVIVSDISTYRLTKARELGFTVLDAKEVNVVEQVRAVTDGKGADVVFEVAGTPVTAQQMVEAVKIQGQIVVVSLFKQPPAVDLALMHFREISLTTTRCYSHADFSNAVHLLSNGTIDLAPLISHELPLDRISEGFVRMGNPEEALKIIIRP